MPVATHQTVRLGRGSHRSPEHGACVMELASMLAGERFTARPACSCSVIAELLRTYNDAVDDARRQRLYPVAALVVGSRADAEIVRRRVDRLRDVVLRPHDRRSRAQRWLQGEEMQRSGARETAWYAGRTLAADGERGLERLIALVEELVAIGAEPGDVSLRLPVGPPHEPAAPTAGD